MKIFPQIIFLFGSFIAGLFVTNVVPEPKAADDISTSSNAESAEPSPRNEIEFNRDIRTILSDNCFACHGPDSGQRQADLRLDKREDAVADRDGYAAIVPGDPDASELIVRVLSDDASEVMPPASHRKKLSEKDKQLLVQWIREGAKWEQHWSLISPKSTKAPKTSAPKWIRNDIDRFVLNKLDTLKIKPSVEAEKRVLIRRLYFDLVGLPPTPEQVKAFVDDPSADAYEKIVKQLLASPHFGERLAVYWLDLVRYADTVGYHGDQDISISPYRDYVIEAFNSNMRFDEFTRQQLGGDLMPNASQSQRIASGYNRLGMMSAEGGVQPEEYLAKYAADRVRTTASVWLGVTLGCAECHDHKFDPFSTEDFYNFASFFADIKERGLYSGAHASGDWGPRVDVPDPILSELLVPIDKDIAAATSELERLADKHAGRQGEWEKAILAKRATRWTTPEPNQVQSYYKTPHRVLNDQSILFSGKPTDEDAYVVRVKPGEGRWTGIRIEAIPDGSLPRKGPGRAGNGNFVLTEMILVRDDAAEMEELKKVANLWPDRLKARVVELVSPTATFEQTAGGGNHPDKKWSASSAIDQDKRGPTWGWAILPQSGKHNELVAQFSQPVEFKKDETLTVVLHQYHGNGSHILGRFRISFTKDASPQANPSRTLPQDIGKILDKPSEKRTAVETKRIRDYFISIAPEFADQRKKIESLRKQREAVVKKHTRTSLVTLSVKPREMRVLPRGNWMDKSGKVVSPTTPAVLPGLPKTDGRPSRLDLANWIASRDNPLTARVFVNRLWKLYFGKGIARVLDDVGSQGGWPTHPELLDYLAIEFVDSGWDIKHMIELMVTSSTYRQSSFPRADLKEIDPENKWLARQARFRLDAELIRDNMLASSGLLVKKIGGRSVKPYQPPGLYRHLNFPRRSYRADAGESQYRRGLYTHWQRQFLHPAMKSFDAPSREECTCERAQSNTPLSALVLLNDPSYVEAARHLAQRAIQQTPQGPQSSEAVIRRRIIWMFQNALSRVPNEKEVAVLLQLYEEHRAHYLANRNRADELLTTGLSPRDKKIAPGEHAALTSVARTLFNLHEFIMRY